ncbi:type III-B CRISPR-associated protein Cas10/Cmr2, partial [Tolypothrix sp. NIES-4075]|uniref:type III-B CRISPR-associated protein Cas10/Cmr2 n=1 Tax=Tolypothrix sp. NIES-4075 TaxID=2005459 RepID=UPI000B5C3A8E
KDEFKSKDEPNPYKRELKQFGEPGCWEFNKLWDAQINYTWESYFVAVPLGSPEGDLEVAINPWNQDNQKWVNLQKQIAQPRTEIPAPAEQQVYDTLNVGSWWGSCQARLGRAIQAIKNTRGWQIPVAPGERSTLSGQYSALHPRLLYQNFQDGLGLPTDSLRLFWRVMSIAYPGVFNGSEKLNAIELTKRLAWKHGGVAEELGIKFNQERDDNYEGLIRFPNLCSIASAHFATHYPQRIKDYWSELRREIYTDLNLHHDKFCSRTRRPFQVRRADAALSSLPDYGNGYNGVMFSSKWLADDMSLNPSETSALRTVVDKVKKRHFGDSSPADWWVLVLGDGDGMGGYVSGGKLKFYEDYIISDLVEQSQIDNSNWDDLLKKTKKRMGPATHVGLNRALLDFSNRLVPHITEERFCGRVIYSGGDDVMAALSLADLPGFLRSLRAAWCGGNDPLDRFSSNGGYWKWKDKETIPADIPMRSLFTMGKEATMSLGIVVAHKSVPLPTVLEKIWQAEKERAKKLLNKDGLCFRVIYGSGNILEALMKGDLLEDWWRFIQVYQEVDLSPLLYRLADELPRHADITKDNRLFGKVAKVVILSRDEQIPSSVEVALINWLDAWEQWAYTARQQALISREKALGANPEDIGMLLRFSAFWVSAQQKKM